MENKRKYKSRKVWRSHEEENLIEVWAQNIEKLRAGRKNKHIYKEMQKWLASKNIYFSIEEIKFKIHNLTSKYRKEIIENSGGTPSEWPPFNKIHAFLGKCKIINTQVVVDDSIAEVLRSSAYSISSSSSSLLTEMVTSAQSTASSQFMPIAANSSSLAAHSHSPPHEEMSASSMSPTPEETKTCKRKRNNNISSGLLKEFKRNNEVIEQELQHIRRTDEELIAIEKQRNNLLQDLVTDSREFQRDLIQLLSHNSDFCFTTIKSEN